MARRRRKQGGFSTFIVILITMGIIGFVLYMVIGNMVQRTATIESGSMGNQYAAQAVIIRDERVSDAEGLTSVKYYANEGELTYKGTKIADVYASGYSQSDINKLMSVRKNIKTQLKTTLASEYTDAELERYDSAVMDYVRELGYLVDGTRAGNLINLERQLTTELNRRHTYLRSKYKSVTALKELYESEENLQNVIGRWTNAIIANDDCIVSFYTDGYESMLTPEKFEDLTLAEARSVLAGDEPPMTSSQRGRTAVLREVVPNGWYILLVSTDKNWNPVNGQTYKVELAGFDSYVVDGTVTSHTRTGNDLLVRMSVSGDVRQVLNVRTSQAEVGEQYVSGLKVPLNALHQQGDKEGVVLAGGTNYFVPVTVIMRDNNYAVIQPQVAGVLSEGMKVLVF